MIASLHGQLRAIRKDSLVVEVSGIGYIVRVPTTLAAQGLHLGQAIELHTHLYVRENELALYGFQTAEELELFDILITVNGIGPRTAMGALSVFAPETLRGIIAQGNAAALTRIPGIGRKTAERMVVDLRDKIGPVGEQRPMVPFKEEDADVMNALTALGYSILEAQDALAGVGSDVQGVDQRILEALRFLGGRAR
jgi:Holliday junction DNA helicase RuvA